RAAAGERPPQMARSRTVAARPRERLALLRRHGEGDSCVHGEPRQRAGERAAHLLATGARAGPLRIAAAAYSRIVARPNSAPAPVPQLESPARALIVCPCAYPVIASRPGASHEREPGAGRQPARRLP